MNLPQTKYPRIVILGGGFGGLHLAKTLDRTRYQVVMIDRNNYHTFQPLLYQVATSGLEPDNIAAPIRKIFEDQDEFYFRMAKAEEIIPEKNLLVTNIGSVEYDYLVLACGTRTNFFGMDQLKQVSLTMKSVRQSLKLRSYILQSFEKALLTSDPEEQQSYMTFVLVGAGPTGVELAGALAELRAKVLQNDYPDLDISKMHICLVEAVGEVLPPMSKEASKKSKKYLEDMGVTLYLNESVSGFENGVVKMKSGKEIKAKTLIWVAGVKGTIIEGLGEDKVEKSRYKVDQFNKVVGTKNIFAIGDVAAMITEKTPKGHPMLAPVATQQGERLGKNFIRISNNKEMKPFEYVDRGTMATIGRNKAVVDLPKWKFQGRFAWFVWMFVHLLSLVGFRNKVITFINWTYNYISFDKGVRLIIQPYKRKN